MLGGLPFRRERQVQEQFLVGRMRGEKFPVQLDTGDEHGRSLLTWGLRMEARAPRAGGATDFPLVNILCKGGQTQDSIRPNVYAAQDAARTAGRADPT